MATRPARGRTSELGLGLRAFFLVMGWALLIVFHGDPGFTTFALVFVSIVLEALPFVLLGAMISGAVEVFLSRDRLAGHLPRRKTMLTLVAAGMGAVFPVCECAVVPVVRRFLKKGLPLSAALAYLLAGPIFNPLVGLSTWVAYAGSTPGQRLALVAVRLISGFAIAFFIGLIMGKLFPGRTALLADSPERNDHSHDACGCGHSHTGDHPPPRFASRLLHALRHGTDDFLDVGQYLVLGAFVAGLLQALVSRQAFLDLADLPLASIPLMMFLAFLLSLCSEADAFLAASFRGSLPFSSQMAFLVLGPMLDVKLVCMYLGVFRKRTIVVLAMMVLVSVYLLMVALHTTLGPWYGQIGVTGGGGP